MKKSYRSPIAKFIDITYAGILAGSEEDRSQSVQIVPDEPADEWSDN